MYSLLFRGAEFSVLNPHLDSQYGFNKHFYVFKHIWVNRIKNIVAGLVDGSFKTVDGKEETLTRMFQHNAEALEVRRKLVLFKENPDSVGRSRVFYYIQKRS